MKKNKKILIICVSLLVLVLLIVVGVTYAYFSAQITGSESSTTITADSGQMTIVYDNGSGVITANNISPDSKPFATKTFTVTGNNTTDKMMPYDLSLVVEENTFYASLSFDLVSVNTSNSGYIIPSREGEGIGYNAETIGLGTGMFGNGTGKVHTYTLKIYFKETNKDQSYDMNKTFKAHIGITAGASLSEPTGWTAAAAGTLLNAIKTNNTISQPLTPNGYPSLSTEAVMYMAPDDYGTSYYFRGNITNNFVSFAGMCWRIVRVTGDGSIKLALYNYNPNSASNPCAASEDGDTNAFARYTGTTYTSAFNTSYNDNAYVGFMYGAVGATTYANAHANTNKSTILTNLETWYTSKMTTYTNKLADTIWCNDKSTVANSHYYYLDGTAMNDTAYPGLGYGTGATVYNAGTRLWGASENDLGTGPSLICPNDNNGGKLSKFTVSDTTNGNGTLIYKMGLLTADELVLSGYPKWSYYNASELTYYLNQNANGTWYWALSPGGLDDHDSVAANVFYVYVDRLAASGVHNAGGVRPSVSLISGATISGGSGTQASPYVVS
jgi:hypothetical protein